ncbi:MAG: hypothetical protein ACOX65_01850 [Anaerotruncus rubiinfantis]|jgi:hypothetical protein
MINTDFLSLVVSFIALIFALLSPIFSSLINGYFRIKEFKLQMEYKEKQEFQRFYAEHSAHVIENFLQSTGKAIQGKENFSDFGSSMSEIYLYVSQELWPLIDDVINLLQEYNYDSASSKLIELSKKLSSENIRNKI